MTQCQTMPYLKELALRIPVNPTEETDVMAIGVPL